MSAPKTFDGIIYPLANNDDHEYTYFLYRRENEKDNEEKFLESIANGNLAWDKPTRKMYYRDMENNLYEIRFKKLKE